MFFLPLESTGTVWSVLQSMEKKENGKILGFGGCFGDSASFPIWELSEGLFVAGDSLSHIWSSLLHWVPWAARTWASPAGKHYSTHVLNSLCPVLVLWGAGWCGTPVWAFSIPSKEEWQFCCLLDCAALLPWRVQGNMWTEPQKFSWERLGTVEIHLFQR